MSTKTSDFRFDRVYQPGLHPGVRELLRAAMDAGVALQVPREATWSRVGGIEVLELNPRREQ